MTAITTSQLDELEQRAKAAQHTACAPVRYFRHPDAPMAVAWSPVIDGRNTCVPQSYADCYRKVDADFVAAADPVTIARLVAIARAALAWSEARLRLQNARYPIGDYDAAAEMVDDAAGQLQSAVRGAP